MSVRSIASPDDQSATWLELFFDLIFVFSITQMVGMFHDGITWSSIGQATLIFWLVWWAWSQFTWALNGADTRNKAVEIATLAAGAVAFAMAVTVPDAFHDRALWFAITYVVVRVFGLGLSILVSTDTSQKNVVIPFAVLSIGGLAAVITGAVAEGQAQYWFWGGAIVLDLIAAQIGGKSGDWGLHIEHFSERHGLFVIIALGESLIIAAHGLAGHEFSSELVLFAVAALVMTFGLWWSYFAEAKDRLDAALEARRGENLTAVLKDSFSLIHFPMLLGVIAIAVVIEEGIAHPDHSFPIEVRLAFGIGLALFVGGMAISIFRAGGGVNIPRISITLTTSLVIVLISGIEAYLTICIAIIGLLALGLVEHLLGEPEHQSASAVPELD